MEPEKRFELIAYVDGEMVGKTSSVDVDDVIGQANTLNELADLKIEEMIEDFAWPVYQEMLHESD